MKLRTRFCVGTAVLLGGALTCHASGGAWVPAGGGAMPGYFTGTNSRASGNAMVDPPPGSGSTAYFVSAELRINGMVVKDWTKPPLEPGPMSIGLSVMFDSQYLDADYAVVTFEAVDSYNRTYSEEGEAPIYRQVHLLNLYEFSQQSGGDGAAAAEEALSPTNYLLNTQPYIGDSSDVENMLSNCTVMYINTHSYESSPLYPIAHLTDAENDLIYPTPDPYYDVPNYESMREAINGLFGAPPYNSTELPNTNLFYLDACTCGRNSNFVSIFTPYTNHYNVYLENQAFIGWNGYMQVSQSELTGYLVFHYLESGLTVGYMQEYLMAYNQNEDPVIPLMIAFETNPITQELDYVTVGGRPDDLKVHGDEYTRVVDAYTGSHTNLGWVH